MQHRQTRRLAAWRLALSALALSLVLGSGGAVAAAAPAQLNEGVGVGARALAMGGAFIAVADDASGGFWNPAGLEGLDKRWASYSGLINNRDQASAVDDFLVYAEPDNGFASGALSIMRDRHEVADPADPAVSTGLSASKTLYAYSLALKAASTGLAFGGTLKYITESVETAPGQSTTGTAFSVDVGGMLRLNPGLSFGFMAQDVMRPALQYTDASVPARQYPLLVHAGVAWRPDDETVFAIDGHDLTAASPSGRTVHVGVERWLTPTIAVRAGAQAGIGFGGQAISGQSITAGAALRYTDWQLDYAFLARNLGNTSAVSLSYRF